LPLYEAELHVSLRTRFGKKKRMKLNLSSVLAGMLLLPSCLFTAHAQSFPPQLRLDRRANALELTVSSLSATGALFIYQAPDLQTLVDSPSLLFETNIVSTNNVRVPIASPSSPTNSAFFSAANWPGRSTGEFGDPEYAPDTAPPTMILISSGVPGALTNAQTFTADFFVTDTTGQGLALNASATVLVLRGIDGQRHPDAAVTPSGGQMTNGHLRLTLMIQATTPLDGYTLGLELAFSSSNGAKALTTVQLQALVLDNSIQCQPGQTPKQCLDAWRLAKTDTNPSWGYPLAGGNHQVAGTFGEGRGNNNSNVHKGLDLVALPNTSVYPSRSGVVSFIGPVTTNKPCLGYCIVIDHGDGWFSLYLHLDGNSIILQEGAGRNSRPDNARDQAQS